MVTFGKPYHQILMTMTAEELQILRLAYSHYEFGPKQAWIMNGHLLSSISGIVGGGETPHSIYPHIFKDNNGAIESTEDALTAVERLLMK